MCALPLVRTSMAKDRILGSLEEVFQEVKAKWKVNDADMPEVEVRLSYSTNYDTPVCSFCFVLFGVGVDCCYHPWLCSPCGF